MLLLCGPPPHLAEPARKHPTLGWGDLVANGLDVQQIPGNHTTLMQEPHVRVLAEKLKSSIEEAAKLITTHL